MPNGCPIDSWRAPCCVFCGGVWTGRRHAGFSQVRLPRQGSSAPAERGWPRPMPGPPPQTARSKLPCGSCTGEASGKITDPVLRRQRGDRGADCRPLPNRCESPPASRREPRVPPELTDSPAIPTRFLPQPPRITRVRVPWRGGQPRVPGGPPRRRRAASSSPVSRGGGPRYNPK